MIPGGSGGYYSPYAGGDAEGIEDAPDLDESDVPSNDPEPGDGGSDHTIISGRNEGTSDTTVEEEETVVDVTGDDDYAVVTTPDSRTDGTPNTTQEEMGVTAPDDSTDITGDQSVQQWAQDVVGSSDEPEMPEIVPVPREGSGGLSPMIVVVAVVAVVVAILGGAADG